MKTQIFNLARAIQILLGQKSTEKDYDVLQRVAGNLVGLEKQLFAELGLKGNLMVPDYLFSRSMTTTSAAGLVANNFRPELMDLVPDDTLNQLLVSQADGFQGSQAIPKFTGNTIGQWQVQGEAIEEPELTTGNDLATSKAVLAFVDVSRTMFKQLTNQTNELLLEHLNIVLDKAIAKALFEGTGLNGQPTGIINHDEATEVDGTDFSYDTILEMTRAGESGSNRLNKRWACSPATKKYLSKTEKVAGSGKFILEDGKINNYPVVVFNQITDNYLHFGDYSSVLLTKYINDILVDIYSSSVNIRIYVWKYLDIVLRNPGSLIYTEIPA